MSIGWAMGCAAVWAAHPAGALPEVSEHLLAARKAQSSGWHRAADAHTSLYTFPEGLTLGLDLTATPAEGRTDARRVVLEASRWWETAAARPNLFRWIEGPARVSVRVVRHLDGAPSEAGGWTRWKRTVTTSADDVLRCTFEADVQIRWLPEAAMRHVAAHELGHLLGLADSPCVGDVMGPVDSRFPVRGLSDADRAALTALQAAARFLAARRQVPGPRV